MIRCPYCWSTDAGHDADAEHARLCATGTATATELLAAFVATLHADRAMCIAFGDTAGAKVLAAEVARAEMVRS